MLSTAIPPAILEQRALELDLVNRVRESREELVMVALRRLLQLRLSRQDQALRRCQPLEFAGVQARAQVLDELMRELFD